MLSEEIALKLLQINAIRLSPQNPFTWASGLRSPVYCDNRLALSYPDIRNLIINGFTERAKSLTPIDLIAGVATAGIAYGALVANRLNAPFAYVRSSAKAHGRQNLIEGQVTPGSHVLVIEDLISTGGSSLNAVEALRESDCTVAAVVAIFQYNFTEAQERFAAANCPFFTLTDFLTLIRVAEQSGHIMESDIALLTSWFTDPSAWQSNTVSN
jgi:orotate phosphoribosyltransferase